MKNTVFYRYSIKVGQFYRKAFVFSKNEVKCMKNTVLHAFSKSRFRGFG